jgi:hypothetical protein
MKTTEEDTVAVSVSFARANEKSRAFAVLAPHSSS